MRPVDADELKDKLRKAHLCCNREWLQIDLDEIIDNAPTVAVDEEIERQREELYQSSKKLFDTARMLGVERPQGEWVKMAFDDKTIFYCSECHSHFEYPFNFCPTCGAKNEL